jgi:hypothetical protein
MSTITKLYLQSLQKEAVSIQNEKIRTIAYIRNCVIDAAKHNSQKLIINNFNHAEYGSGLIRGGIVLTSNCAGVGRYDGTYCFYEIVRDTLGDLCALFPECIVELVDGRLLIDWS